ncbi:MAG: exodeoxyribonuclease VII large subunit [Nanoarchaeota archaeon]|nr:exodeoxyribonuclease VII large subunit [Nanoarchaeota archaeon]MBU1135344.1 exodeoxyribonuclease VII large subunit [Nanoarchaeota archaeon]MBU2519708.1 exodeoxyribonuclease VII large subunit [Nanoarchaeota archaeon]
MKEQQLIRFSLIGAILGIIALYFVSQFAVSATVNIGEISNNFLGTSVTVSGEINNLYKHKDGHLFFNLADETGEIKTVIWDDVVKQLEIDLKNGDKLKITGEITTYKGDLELIPLGNRVEILN